MTHAATHRRNITGSVSRFGWASKAFFRCIYCKKRLKDRMTIPSHEAQCPLRETVRWQWARALAVARAREAKGAIDAERS